MLAVGSDSGMNSSTNNNSSVANFKDKTSSLKQHQCPVPTVLDSHNHQNLQQEQTPSPSDHYIHSRLKSALGSGRKEVYYSGVLDGGRVRRVASLNAQAMNQMLCLTESALSVPVPKTDSPGADSTQASQNIDVECTPLNGSCALPNRTDTSCESSSSNGEAISDTVMSSPLSSPSSSSTTANTFLPTMPTGSPSPKNASVDVVDVMKKRVRKQRNTKTPSTVDHNTGFVKRIASLNAQAFVSVLVRSSRTTQAGGEGGKKRLRNSNYNNSKKRKVDQNDVSAAEEVLKMGADSSEDDAAPGSTEEHPVAQQHDQSPVCASSSSRLCSSELLASSSSQDEPSHDEALCSLESVPCNTLGLLYSGDCISANRSILLTTEEHLPERVIPLIVPIHAFEVNFAKAKALKKTSSAVGKRKSKGNNGWTIESEPIKVITIRGQAGTNECRKYYIGLKRQNERLFVRDSVMLRSGKKENPYVAKISSIWQEGSGGIMMTVFWYYRPEDTTPLVSSMFHESEIMASQHHDDVSVACVDDKCLVLGFSQYCRYMAAKKRSTCEALHHSIVPGLSSNQDDSSSSHFHLNKQKAHSSSQEEEGQDVFVCYRAYNHFTGRVVRAGISYK